MIFDDIFSGLDRLTARKIFYALFSSDGILRRLRTTVILATHSCKCQALFSPVFYVLTIYAVEFVEAADSILRFDDAGNVVAEVGQGDRELRQINEALESSPERQYTTEKDAAETTVKKADSNQEQGKENGRVQGVHHKGDWTLWLFFMKSAPKWMFGFLIFISCAEAVAERITCKPLACQNMARALQ